jgi:Arc/MetJ-type ribon-helix-helix transcriptional regulator
MATFTISLPAQIAKKIDAESKTKGFASRSEFIRSLLRVYFYKKPAFEVFDRKPLNEVKLELAKTGKYSEKFIESVVHGLSKSSLYEN